jgi:hypothetical protein
MSARLREGEEGNPTLHCKHVSIGLYKVQGGTYEGTLKSKKKDVQNGTSPPTCFWCSFHEVAVCRKFNCWERHLSEVERNAQNEFAI